MNICIYGAGAIGAIFAVRLAQCGANISVIARNDSFQAIAEKGSGWTSQIRRASLQR